MYSYVNNNPLTMTDPTGMNGGCDYTSATAEDCATAAANCQATGQPWDCFIDGTEGCNPDSIAFNDNCSGGGGFDVTIEIDLPPSSPPPAVPPGPSSANVPPGPIWPEGGPQIPPGLAGIFLPANCAFNPTCGGIPGQRFGPGVIVGAGGTLVCEIAEPCGVIEDVGLVVGVVATAAAVIHQFSKKRDIKQANDAWKEVQKICAAVGKQLDDNHREQWHDAITGQGLGFGDLVSIGVQMFCPEAASTKPN